MTNTSLPMTETDNRLNLLTRLQKHAERVDDVEQFCTDEAKTETYLVEPLLGVLGYDCSAPRDVIKRYSADVPGRKGEKVDYALMRDGEPVVLVEAKGRGNRLGRWEIEQLQRYFPHTPARLAVLTDGIQWRWYKGMSERGQSHQMESSPFLTYNASEPSEIAAEWLTHLSKDGFNPDALLRVSRRIEFTDKIRNWISRSLISPSAAGAAQISDVAELGASDDEIRLVVEAIQAAWKQVTDGHVVVRQQAAEDDRVDSSTNAADADSSNAPATWTPTPASSEDTPTLQSTSHWDEHLEFGDGRVLDSRRQPRAWRIGDQDWSEEKNGTLTAVSVLAELLRCDARHRDEKEIAEDLELHYSLTKPRNNSLRNIPGFPNIYWYANVNNDYKARQLEGIASKIQFNPPPGNPLAEVPRIEWWLPNKPKR